MGLFNFLFLSTPSARRATFPTSKPTRKQSYFYPRPPRGGRPTPSKTGRRGGDFYPRPPRGGRREEELAAHHQKLFLSTPSARRATERLRVPRLSSPNFYPRPPRGGRLALARLFVHGMDFYPRPPRGGRPSARFRSPTLCLNFYPRPPRGGRPELYTAGRLFNGISIHALREEGDAMRSTPSSTSSRFLSTPSARRATACENHRTRPECYFYPRPPRGGRQVCLVRHDPVHDISIHALREEGDRRRGSVHLPCA